MQTKISRRRLIALSAAATAIGACGTTSAKDPIPLADSAPAYAVTGAKWFTGDGFETKTGYSVRGRFTFRKPAKIDETLDMAGAFIVPPFADAHNHGIGTGVAARDQSMVAAYLRAGVFYAQSMGNLPIDAADKERLGIGAPGGLDATFAQGSITGPGGHPMGLIRNVLLPQGFFPGQSLETLEGVRFFQIASEAELRAKWPAIVSARPDFIKFFLFNSETYSARRDDPATFGRRGIDPALAKAVVQMAHAEGLRAAAHVVSVDDVRVALDAGADVLGHLPADGVLGAREANAIAKAGTPIHTTCGFLARIAGAGPVGPAAIGERMKAGLVGLKQAGAKVVIGADDPMDVSVKEVDYLRQMGVFTDAELLRMWTGATAESIFPGRDIGRLAEGYEASFVALEGDPLADWSAVKRIRARFKQGRVMTPPA